MIAKRAGRPLSPGRPDRQRSAPLRSASEIEKAQDGSNPSELHAPPFFHNSSIASPMSSFSGPVFPSIHPASAAAALYYLRQLRAHLYDPLAVVSGVRTAQQYAG